MSRILPAVFEKHCLVRYNIDITYGFLGCSFQELVSKMKTETCIYSGYKIHPGHGKRLVRSDGKVRLFFIDFAGNFYLPVVDYIIDHPTVCSFRL